jgi:hypothetical protein
LNPNISQQDDSGQSPTRMLCDMNFNFTSQG